MIRLFVFVLTLASAGLVSSAWAGATKHNELGHSELDSMIAAHARANGIPESLVHRVVRRESGYNPHLVGSGGAMGLMQIKQATARGLGYAGSAAGLLDAETNLTYA